MKKIQFVTTTNNVEGYEIKKYMEPVFSHIVAGTNIFSDIAASARDIFGGRSASYENQLNKINEEAINSIKKKSLKQGADGIVGLKVDIDEISGKNVSMFMISAYGTPVVVEKIIGSTPESYVPETVDEDKELITQEEIQRENYKQDILDRLTKGILRLNESTLEFIQETCLAEAVEIVLNKIKDDRFGLLSVMSPSTDNLFSLMNRDQIITYLYPSLWSQELVVYNFLIKIIKKSGAVDYSILRDIFQGDYEAKSFQRAVKILMTVDKEEYFMSDLRLLQEIKGILENKKYPPLGKIIQGKSPRKKGMIWMWECQCGKKNELPTDYGVKKQRVICSECRSDMYGFSNSNDLSKIISVLNQKIKLLEQSLPAKA